MLIEVNDMLPELTHLQFFVLAILLDGEKSGREVRAELAGGGVKKTGPAFYQLMARAEDAGYIKGWYDEKVIDGQMIRERRYKLTGKGGKACQQTQDFYASHGTGKGQVGYA